MCAPMQAHASSRQEETGAQRRERMAAAGQTLFNELRMFFTNGAQLTQVNREDIKRVSGLRRIRVLGGSGWCGRRF